MSEDSGGSPAMGSAPGGNNNNGSSQKRKKKNANFVKHDLVKGETPELSDHVYDIGPNFTEPVCVDDKSQRRIHDA